MGSKQLDKPKLIGEKLRVIRRELGITQAEMYERLKNAGAKIHVGYIGNYERNDRIPSLLVTLYYSQVTGVSMEDLVNDQINPEDVVPTK